MPAWYSIWARDDAGRWHYASDLDGEWDNSEGSFEVRLEPALHPRATSLDVFITSESARIAVTIPLGWQEVPS